MRIAIVAESFLPQVNGVSNSVRHVTRQLVAQGHDVLIIAPSPGDDDFEGVPVVRVRSLPLPRYQQVSVALPDTGLQQALRDFRPDVVHLACPTLLGFYAVRAARRLGVPTVAVFQTDLAGFAKATYRVNADLPLWTWFRRLHGRCGRTLAPSSSTARQLIAHGIPRVYRWGRGVDTELFHPSRRSQDLHDRWAPDGQVVVGYVGRLAAEKEVGRLAALRDVPGVKLVVVGDGPERAKLERLLPEATFTGEITGEPLAEAFATVDVFCHTGPHETFCQTVQEAQASGVAAVAPAVGGPVDLIDSGRTGLLFDPTDPGALRAAVVRLTSDTDARRAMAAAGLEAVGGRSWRALVQTLVDQHYRAVCTRNQSRMAA